MPRSPEDTAVCRLTAKDIRYRRPPADIEPKGLMHSDPAWGRLVDWFRANVGHDVWPTCLLVYLSERFDEPMSSIYPKIDSFLASTAKRLDREDDPDEFVSYN